MFNQWKYKVESDIDEMILCLTEEDLNTLVNNRHKNDKPKITTFVYGIMFPYPKEIKYHERYLPNEHFHDRSKHREYLYHLYELFSSNTFIFDIKEHPHFQDYIRTMIELQISLNKQNIDFEEIRENFKCALKKAISCFGK